MARLEELLRFKADVKRDEVHPMMFAWLGVIAAFHHETTGRVMRVTSLRRTYRPGARSRHSPRPPALSSAADIGRRELDKIDHAEAFCVDIQRVYGKHLGVVLEPEWLTIKQLEKRFGIVITTKSKERAARRRVGPHIHLQLKGRLWIPGEVA